MVDVVVFVIVIALAAVAVFGSPSAVVVIEQQRIYISPEEAFLTKYCYKIL